MGQHATNPSVFNRSSGTFIGIQQSEASHDAREMERGKCDLFHRELRLSRSVIKGALGCVGSTCRFRSTVNLFLLCRRSTTLLVRRSLSDRGGKHAHASEGMAPWPMIGRQGTSHRQSCHEKPSAVEGLMCVVCDGSPCFVGKTFVFARSPPEPERHARTQQACR